MNKSNHWILGGGAGNLLAKTRLLQRGLRRLFDVPPPPKPMPRAAAREPSAATDRPPATFAWASHTFEGATRRYKLFTPASPAARPWLVVMLHGCKQDPDDFAAGTRMNDAAEKAGFLVLYPQQSRDANPQACWNWFGPREQRGDGEAALIADLTRHVVAAHGVDPQRVYVAGLSAGGAMAAIVAAANPTLFAAAGVHSGLPAGAAGNLPDALMAMRNGARRHGPSAVPTIVFHGDADRTVHPDNADGLIESVLGETAHAVRTSTERTGDVARYTRTEHLDATGATRAEHWVLHGAGHAWAGGGSSGSYTDPAGVDATAEMLRFFGQHHG